MRVIIIHNRIHSDSSPDETDVLNQLDLVMIEDPGHVGVHPVAVDQRLGKTGHQLRRRVLAGVDRAGHEQVLAVIAGTRVIVSRHRHYGDVR